MAVVNLKREDEIRDLEELEDTLRALEGSATEWGFRENLLNIQRVVAMRLDERYVARARDAR